MFAAGPAYVASDPRHPRTRADIVRDAADALGIAPDALDDALYADLPGAAMLREIGRVWTPDDLIARYNVELARALLYWCDRMTIEIHDTYKDFWRYLKFFKLMFEATPLEHGYRVELDGPISPFVHATTRYGRQFAAFLPALFLCERWHMDASIRMAGAPNAEPLRYTLDASAPLRSHFPKSGLYDSRLEADFAAEFAAKFGGERAKWTLTREDEVIVLGDRVMIPDFALTHRADGRRALVEIVGYWHPDYLRRKVSKVREAERRDLILLVYEGVNLTRERLRDAPNEVLYFGSKPVLKDVIAAAERVAL